MKIKYPRIDSYRSIGKEVVTSKGMTRVVDGGRSGSGVSSSAIIGSGCFGELSKLYP